MAEEQTDWVADLRMENVKKVRKLAKKYLSPEENNEFESIPDALISTTCLLTLKDDEAENCSFLWNSLTFNETQQGHDYWYKIANRLDKELEKRNRGAK